MRYMRIISAWMLPQEHMCYGRIYVAMKLLSAVGQGLCSHLGSLPPAGPLHGQPPIRVLAMMCKGNLRPLPFRELIWHRLESQIFSSLLLMQPPI